MIDKIIVENCVSDQDILCHSNLSLLHTSLTNSTDSSRDGNPWTGKLETAQNVLFCKELFSHLAREAVQLQAAIPHMVVGNQITASVYYTLKLLSTLLLSNKNFSLVISWYPDYDWISSLYWYREKTIS